MDELNTLTEKAKTAALNDVEKTNRKELISKIKEADAEIETLEAAEELAKKKVKATPAKTIPGAPQDDASEYKELTTLARTFKISKAFKNIQSRKNHDGVEAEVFEIARDEMKESGNELTGNVAIPEKFIHIGDLKKSQLTVGTEGTDVVFTEYGGKVIPFLHPEPVADKLGVTMLQGLRGNVQFPRETNLVAFSWETETSNVDETIPTFNNISLDPKRVGGYVDITMQMLKQSVFVLEPWLRNKLNLRYALTIDHAVLNGTGSSNQPTGIFNYSGVNVLSLGSSGGDMTYAALGSLRRDARVADARSGRAGWITHPYGTYALSITGKQPSGVEGNFIYDYKNGLLLGDPIIESTTIPIDFTDGSQTDGVGIIYSPNWGGAMVGTWGGLDILFDPYTQALGGKVRFVCNAFMDVEIEQAAEFSYCKDWDATDLPALT